MNRTIFLLLTFFYNAHLIKYNFECSQTSSGISLNKDREERVFNEMWLLPVYKFENQSIFDRFIVEKRSLRFCGTPCAYIHCIMYIIHICLERKVVILQLPVLWDMNLFIRRKYEHKDQLYHQLNH